MRTVSERQVNHGLSELLSAVEGGEEVVITRQGKPVAKMVPCPVEPTMAERQAAMERALQIMSDMGKEMARQGIKIPPGGFSRDEMHER